MATPEETAERNIRVSDFPALLDAMHSWDQARGFERAQSIDPNFQRRLPERTAPVDRQQLRIDAAKILHQLGETEAKIAKNLQPTNPAALFNAVLDYYASLATAEAQGMSGVQRTKASGMATMASNAQTRLAAIETRRNASIPATAFEEIDIMASMLLQGGNAPTSEFSDKFSEFIMSQPDDQQQARLNALKRESGLRETDLIRIARAFVPAEGVTDQDWDRRLGRLAQTSTELSRTEDAARDEMREAVNQLNSTFGGLGRTAGLGQDWISTMFELILGGDEVDGDQVARLLGMTGLDEVPESGQRAQINKIVEDMLAAAAVEDEVWNTMMGWENDIMHGSGAEHDAFVEFAAARDYDWESDPRGTFRRLKAEYLATLSENDTEARVKWAQGVLSGEIPARTRDIRRANWIKATEWLQGILPGGGKNDWARIQAAREGRPEEEVRAENDASAQRHADRGVSLDDQIESDAAPEVSDRVETTPTEGALTETTPTETTPEQPSESDLRSNAAAMNIQRNADSVGEAIRFGSGRTYLVPGGNGQLHHFLGDGRSLVPVDPQWGERGAPFDPSTVSNMEELKQVARELRDEGALGAKLEGGESLTDDDIVDYIQEHFPDTSREAIVWAMANPDRTGSDNWADYTLHSDGRITFTHPGPGEEKGQEYTVTERQAGPYWAIRNKAFGDEIPQERQAAVDSANLRQETRRAAEREADEPAPEPTTPSSSYAQRIRELSHAQGRRQAEEAARADAPPPTLYDRAVAINAALEAGGPPPEESDQAQAIRLGFYRTHTSSRPGQLSEDTYETNPRLFSKSGPEQVYEHGYPQPGMVTYERGIGDRERGLRDLERIAKEMREGGESEVARVRREYGTSVPPQRQTPAPPPTPEQPGGLEVDLGQLGAAPTGEVVEEAAPAPVVPEEELAAPIPESDPIEQPSVEGSQAPTPEEEAALLDMAQRGVGRTGSVEPNPEFALPESGPEILPDPGEISEGDTGRSPRDTGLPESEAGDTGLGVSGTGDTGGGLSQLAALGGDTDEEDTDEGEEDAGEEGAAPAGRAPEQPEFGPGQPGYMPDPPPLQPAPIPAGGGVGLAPAEPPVEQAASAGQPKRVSKPPGVTAFEAQAHNITPASPSAMAASVPSLSMASGAQGQTDSPRARYNKRKTQALTDSLQQRLQKEQEQTSTTVA